MWSSRERLWTVYKIRFIEGSHWASRGSFKRGCARFIRRGLHSPSIAETNCSASRTACSSNPAPACFKAAVKIAGLPPCRADVSDRNLIVRRAGDVIATR